MIREKVPDFKKALSLIEIAKIDLNFVLKFPLNNDSTNTIVRNIYESFRMLGEALLTAEGIKSEDHTLPVKRVVSLDIRTDRPLMILEMLRSTRRNINYYGYHATIAEAEYAVDFAKKCFEPVYQKVLKILRDMQNNSYSSPK